MAWIAHAPNLHAQNHGDRGGRNQEIHRRQHPQRRWRRRRRRPSTTPAADRGPPQSDRLVGDVLLATAPQRQGPRQQQQRRQQKRQALQLRSRSKSPQRSHGSSHRRPGGGGDGARAGTSGRKGQKYSGGAGGLDCYRTPNSGKTAADTGHRGDVSPHTAKDDGADKDGGRPDLGGDGLHHRGGGNACPSGG